MKIKLTKLRESPNPLHPNNIGEGYVVVGEIDKEPKVGGSLMILREDGVSLFDRIWSTSKVEEIIDENTFRTMNSIYTIEYLDN